MIHVTFSYNEAGRIHSFIVKGHADSGPYGHDLVCSAVSAITFGAVNAVLELTEIKLEITQGDDGGYLEVKVPQKVSEKQQAEAELLFRGMLVSLQTVEQNYGKHLSISK